MSSCTMDSLFPVNLHESGGNAAAAAAAVREGVACPPSQPSNGGCSGGGSSSSSDIIQKINSMLDNKFVFGDLFPPQNNKEEQQQQQQQQQRQKANKERFIDANGNSSCSESVNQPLEAFEKSISPPPPQPHSAAGTADFLGLSPRPAVKTYNNGDFKFPDVTSPLNRILTRSRHRSVSSIEPYFGSGGSGCTSGCFYHRSYSSEAGSPTFDEAILMGVASSSSTPKWDVDKTGRHSPGSDGAYGTSYGSVVSRHDNSGLSDLFKGLSFNETAGGGTVGGGGGSGSGGYNSSGYNSNSSGVSSFMDSPPPPPPSASAPPSLQGSPLSSHSAAAAAAVAVAAATAAQTTSPPPGFPAPVTGSHLPSIAEMDPAVAQAFQSLRYEPSTTEPMSLEKAARIHRNGTALYDASCIWRGQLPPRSHKNLQLSCKVFLGGVPWDITETALVATFKPFGPIRIEWPGKDNSSGARGYLYIIFENENQVKDLLAACSHDYGNGGSWYYKITSRRMRNKEVQVIPWVIGDSNYVRCHSQRLDPQKTIFVGALHGMLNAEGLAKIFDELFGGVIYAGVDTDKYKYPTGSGRVTFNNSRSYMHAVSAAFIEIKTPKFTKKVQVDPYLEDALCSACALRQGPYFCRDVTCFKYFCRGCWELYHSTEITRHHKPLMRNGGPNTGARTVSFPFE